jgi:CRISPR-associated protein Cmr6
MMMVNQALPRPTRQLLENHQQDCRHLGLMLDKFAPWGLATPRRGAPYYDVVMQIRRRRRGQWQTISVDGAEAKGQWITQGRPAARQGEDPSLFEVPRADIPLMAAQRDRWQTTIDSAGERAAWFAMQTASRLAIGLGAAHVLETALSLDRNTGAPYIAGSSLKGLARAMALYELALTIGITTPPSKAQNEGKEPTLNQLNEWLTGKTKPLAGESATDTEARYISNPTGSLGKRITSEFHEQVRQIRRVFGHQGAAGVVNFLPAVYDPQFDDEEFYTTDVMTPHYPDYYQEKALPADDQNPNPVTFLTVRQGIVFRFGVMLRTGSRSEDGDLGLAAGWLRGGLQELGIGGKTAAGYGFFEEER